MPPEPNEIVWLDIAPEKIGNPRQLEYRYKSLMVHVRAVLETRVQTLGSHSEITLTGTAEAKLPVIGAHNVSARTLIRSEQKDQTFDTYADRIGANPDNVRSGEGLSAPSGRALNALLLPHALEQSWSADTKTYAAWFVTGTALFALRIDKVDASGLHLEARAMRKREALTEEGWKQLDWENRQPCELRLNPTTKIIEEFSIRHSMLGQIRLPLVGR
jgi:hypothetical protein